MSDSTLVDTLAQVHSQSSQISGWSIFFIALGVIVFVSLLGLFLLKKRRTEVIDEIQFSSDYLEKLLEYLESHGKDMNTYSWLVDRSTKMQRMMGAFGMISYITPYQQYKVNNQDIVINFVPQIKKSLIVSLIVLLPHLKQYHFMPTHFRNH